MCRRVTPWPCHGRRELIHYRQTFVDPQEEAALIPVFLAWVRDTSVAYSVKNYWREQRGEYHVITAKEGLWQFVALPISTPMLSL